jgi:aldehyde oxidoreductase
LLTLRGAQFIGAGYDIKNIRGEGRTVCTNHAWGSAFRGYGSPQSEFASEVLMDELAEKLGMDPLELRFKNCYRKGATTPTGQDPEVYSLPEMLTLLRPKYEEAKKKTAAASTDTVKRGVGIALGVYGCGLDGPDTAETVVGLNADGTVTIYNTWEDHGQGADMGTLGTAHEALRPLGITAAQIRLVMNDTSTCPNSGPAGGSRSQVVVGQSIRVGCEELVKSMQKSDGTFRSFVEMVAENIPTKVNGKWSAPAGNCDENGQGNPFCCYMYGLFMAEVAVELATGKTTVEKMTCVADVGKIVNKLVVDGQLYGGMAQAIGLALTEDFEDIKKHSTMVGAGFPYIKQIPDDMELIYVETPRPDGPFGASGVGELPLTCPHAAVINGIYNACGARIRRLPALPEKVLAALKK